MEWWQKNLMWTMAAGSLAMVFPAEGQEQLESISVIRALSKVSKDPVPTAKIAGVVTYRFGRENGSFTVQDDTGGIFVEAGDIIRRDKEVEWLPANREAAFGDIVEVTGTVSLESFAPYLIAHSVKILGKGELPVARKVSLSELSNGKWDSNYVEIEATVRYARHANPSNVERLAMDLRTPEGRFSGFLTDNTGADPAELIDSTVRLRGVNLFYFNRKMQPLQPILQMTDMGAVDVLTRSTTGKFEVPYVPVAKFHTIRPDGLRMDRIKVKGTVTHIHPGEFLCI